jgi:NADH-quinone oxidoreductase subunit M
VRGSWPILPIFTAIAMIGLLFTGAYILKGIKKVLHGPTNEHWIGHVSEMNFREIIVISPLLLLILWTGVWPAWILDVINSAMQMLFSG